MELDTFIELNDRYEKTFSTDSYELLISIDKSEISDLTESLLSHIQKNLNHILTQSLEYFDTQKDNRGVGFIDDLSDPQVLLSRDGFSIYWISDKGEARATSVVGIDYVWPTLEPRGVTLGD